MHKKICIGLVLASLFGLTACGAARKNTAPDEAASHRIYYGGKLIVKNTEFMHAKISDLLAKAAEPTTVLEVLPLDMPITSEFGMRRLGGRSARLHKGVDISAPRGTPVSSSGPGRVVFAGSKRAYGRTVEIDHGNGVVTRYAHLDKMFVQVGESVEAGQEIGTVGRSGRTTGANLHFEVLVNEENIDPAQVLSWS